MNFAAGTVLALICAAAVWFFVAPHGAPPVSPPATSVLLAPPTPATPPVAPAPAPEPAAPAPTARSPAPAPSPLPIAVASVPAAETYALADWTEAKTPSGFLDGVTLEGASLDPEKSRLLVGEDVLTATGWAGDRALGIRFPKVLLAMCGRIVAAADVGLDRPDVAKAVHPNLAKSGWSARLLVGHLPRCAGATLAAWAVAPFGKVVFPLAGAVALDLPPARPLDPALTVETHPLPRPADMSDAAKPVKIVARSKVNMRRCGSTRCKVVGQLAPGTHIAGLLDRADGWALVVTQDQATGWLAERVVTIEPVK